MEKGMNILDLINNTFGCGEVDIRTYSPLTLAYMGDAVYDMIIRTVVVERGNQPANQLHRAAVRYVNAEAQASMISVLMEELTEEELRIYRRGKNAKSNTSAKNASPRDYKKATGFEALLGYLFLTNNQERILELVKIGLHKLNMEL